MKDLKIIIPGFRSFLSPKVFVILFSNNNFSLA